MVSKYIKTEDVISTTTLESGTQIMTIKRGLLSESVKLPVIHLAASYPHNPDIYDMACESLMRFYMAQKPAIKNPVSMSLDGIAKAFNAEVPGQPQTAEDAPTSLTVPVKPSKAPIYDW